VKLSRNQYLFGFTGLLVIDHDIRSDTSRDSEYRL
jgi:hypothetical protein